jgi:hypothetical protein
MSVFEAENEPARPKRVRIFVADLDAALTAQLVVAWAGEAGEEKRLGWWRSDLVSEFGGEDLFRRLLPATWRWAVLQGAREAARRVDAERRKLDNDPDRIVSLFSLGFELDERIEERLQDLKRGGDEPVEALEGLSIIQQPWSRDRFFEWVAGHGQADHVASPAGRRIKGEMPGALSDRVRVLVAGLAPAADEYPLPHFRRA